MSKKKNNTNGFRIAKSNKEAYEYLLSYFPQETKNWYKLKNLITGFDVPVDSIQKAKNILSFYDGKKVKISEILELFLGNLNEEFTTPDISKLLNRQDMVETIRNYLNLLNEMKILKSRVIRRKNSFVRLYSLEPNIQNWRLPSLPQSSTLFGRSG